MSRLSLLLDCCTRRLNILINFELYPQVGELCTLGVPDAPSPNGGIDVDCDVLGVGMLAHVRDNIAAILV